jgi:2-phospho-L-lactate guanylyltransferase
MKIFAVVPVKRLATSKRRLAPVLTPEERKRLTLAMLEDVLNALRGSTVQRAVVVGSDSRVCELAAGAGFSYKQEDGRGLNRAITGSIEWVLKRGADAVLILPADLPLLSSVDIDRIIEIAGNAEQTVVVSPSQNGGTNALYMRPANLIPVSYGPGSFKRHVNFSRRRGARLKVYYSPSVAFDIDSQKDLQKMLATPKAALSVQLVAKLLRKDAA